jgi:hypothetical protein
VSALTDCKACEDGKFQELTRATEYTCKFCAAGKSFDTKSTVCITCEEGQYQESNNLASAVCKECAIKQYSPSITATCLPCASGMYSSEEGQTVCKSCDDYPNEFINSQCCGGSCPQLNNQCEVSCS